jgi:hypothetical protein
MKTTATTEAVSSSPGENGHWNTKWRRTTPAPGKNRWRTEKMSCKTMKQNENEQNYKKTVHAGRGRETKWEIPGNIDLFHRVRNGSRNEAIRSGCFCF